MQKGLPFLFSLGRLFSPLYGMVMRGRAFLYRHGVFWEPERLPAVVVSIGNLTMGGTGKTPLVLYVGRCLLRAGRKPAIASRGYRGRTSEPVTVVSDGGKVLAGPEVVGDEPVLLAEGLAGVPVLVGPDRARVGRFAVERFGVDTVVLDDGFQHLQLARDIDLVLFSARTFLGNGRVFPGGMLREPFSALKRAHGFVITGADKTTRAAADAFKRVLQERYPDIPVFMGEYLPAGLLAGRQATTSDLDKARQVPLYGFAGIADPASFQYTLEKEGFTLAGFQGFADHYSYRAKDVEGLVQAAMAKGAKGLITTEKDFVKLRSLPGKFPLFALRVELFMEKEFDSFLIDRIGA